MLFLGAVAHWLIFEVGSVFCMAYNVCLGQLLINVSFIQFCSGSWDKMLKIWSAGKISVRWDSWLLKQPEDGYPNTAFFKKSQVCNIKSMLELFLVRLYITIPGSWLGW